MLTMFFFHSDTDMLLFMQAWVFHHFQSIGATDHWDGDIED